MNRYKNPTVGDRFRFASPELRDEAMRESESTPKTKCLPFNTNDEYCFRVIATKDNPGRPEDIREWLDEGMDEPVAQEEAEHGRNSNS